jgi:uncharacterized protein (TIGR02246 family)
MRLAYAALVAFLPAMGCTQAVDHDPITTGPEVEAVRVWFEQYNAAINAGVLDQWTTFVADDAVILPPDEPPIIGMDAIRSRYAAVFNAYSFQFTGRLEEITVAGRLAVVRATIEETVTPTSGGEPTELRGAWLLVLRRQPDGSWKLWRNMWSVFPPPMPVGE